LWGGGGKAIQRKEIRPGPALNKKAIVPLIKPPPPREGAFCRKWGGGKTIEGGGGVPRTNFKKFPGRTAVKKKIVGGKTLC